MRRFRVDFLVLSSVSSWRSVDGAERDRARGENSLGRGGKDTVRRTGYQVSIDPMSGAFSMVGRWDELRTGWLVPARSLRVCVIRCWS